MNPYPHLTQSRGSHFTSWPLLIPAPSTDAGQVSPTGCSPAIQLSAPCPLGKDTCFRAGWSLFPACLTHALGVLTAANSETGRWV